MRGFPADHDEKKAPRKLDAFVAAMLAHPTVEAAAAVGIAVSTAYRWLANPLVIQRLAEARRDAMKAAMGKLQQAASEAVDCLCDIQREGQSESARGRQRARFSSRLCERWNCRTCRSGSTNRKQS